jgi:hypothetical protein
MAHTALGGAEPRGMRPLVAHCQPRARHVHRDTGDHRDGHESVATAMMMYREMSMRVWLDETEALMRELSS